MKVILLAPTPPPVGGIAVWTTRMMKAKLKNDWVVDVVDEKIIGNRDVFGDRQKRNLIDEVKRCFNIWSNLLTKLKDKNAKVVHACIPAGSLSISREIVSAIITKAYSRKFIVHFRCTVPNMVKSSVNRVLLKIICSLSDCVMVLNQQSADFIEGLAKCNITLIPNFVESEEVEKFHIINEHIGTVLYTGGVTEAKGCIDLIKVARLYPNVEFRMIGKPETKVIEAVRNIKNVKLLGTQSHDVVHQELLMADVFAFIGCFPGEGFSNSLAEAMACGVPCLVSDWAANKDMIEDKGGVVVPVKDTEAAIKALHLMSSRELREKQSVFNIQKVKQSYSAEVVLDQYVDCYENVLS